MPIRRSQPKIFQGDSPGPKSLQIFRDASYQILRLATRGIQLPEFLREVLKILLRISASDTAIIFLKEDSKCYRAEVKGQKRPLFNFKLISCGTEKRPRHSSSLQEPALETLRKRVMTGQRGPYQPFFTRSGSFWSKNRGPHSTALKRGTKSRRQPEFLCEDCQSLAIIPLPGKHKSIGTMELYSARSGFFSLHEIESYEVLARILGMALGHQRAQIQLRERVKELTCLYGIARLMERPDIPQNEILQGIAELLPPAWLYPEIASSRIILDDQTYHSGRFKEGADRQVAEIVVGEKKRGQVEVTYSESRPEIHEGPFLREERSLIDTVAREVALLVERFKVEEDREKLQDQLRHADRLATIGQLSAGVAHELNEPLGNILGFSQLAMKDPELPIQASQDIEKIVTATLHAREVVKKLMLFSRQVPPRTDQVDLNQVIEDGLYFLEARCTKAGIQLIRDLYPDLPKLPADSSQIHQVLVNLVVNAVQAMPEGGRLVIRTQIENHHVSLIVEDTGVGMSQEVMKQIFLPFFTTKDVGEGTGLGLAVVHGIVTSHGGTVTVESQPGRGTRFEVRLPVEGVKDQGSGVKDQGSESRGPHG